MMRHHPTPLARPPHRQPIAASLPALLLACATLGWSAPASAQFHGSVHAGSHGPRLGLTVSVPLVQVGGRHRGGGYRHGGGHWHGHGHGHGWAGLALGLGIGALILARPWEPVVVEQRPPLSTSSRRRPRRPRCRRWAPRPTRARSTRRARPSR